MDPNKKTGFALILAGSLGLMLLALLLVWPHLPEWFAKMGKAEAGVEAETETQKPAEQNAGKPLPVPTGSSELQDYYASHPYVDPNKVVIKEEDEGYEYYTRPDGSHWKKDSNSMDVVGDAKKGSQSFRQEIAGGGLSDYATSIHVEFWESSVGFSGYQLKGNNLYLYGISPDDTLRFERHDNGVWMYRKHKIYLLKESDKDTPFEELKPDA